jgi:hypothetical protein
MNMEMERENYPEKNAKNAYVAYTAQVEFAEVVASTWPPPPSPVRALNIPGHKKQTKPSMTIWVMGW